MASDESSDRTAPSPGRWFPTTHWSLVLAAGQETSTQSREALENLCRVYWPPLYAYVRRQGQSPEDAQDLTQDFFARLFEKDYLSRADQRRGRFRTFLLTSLKHFLVNEWEKRRAAKRGGGQVMVCDLAAAEAGYASAGSEGLSPERLYERRWAQALLAQAAGRLREEYIRFGKLPLFERLKDLIWSEGNSPYVELSRQLNMSEGALKVAVHRLRHRYQEMLHAEVAQTVSSPSEMEDELRHLLAVLQD